MKPPLATALHAISVVVTATAFAIAYAFLSVYILDDVDPKFGAAGTVQLLALMAGLSSSVAAVGSSLFHFRLRKRSTGNSPAVSIVSGAVVGIVVAAVHKTLLFNVPVLPGISDWQQQCLYFLVLGYVLHWGSLPFLRIVLAQQAVQPDHREDAAPG